MIKVVVKKDEITISGHAGYDEAGKDIVCAAVSATVITSVNGILSLCDNSLLVKESDGYVNIKVLKHNDVVDKLLSNMINLLTELKNDYKDNIDIRRC